MKNKYIAEIIVIVSLLIIGIFSMININYFKGSLMDANFWSDVIISNTIDNIRTNSSDKFIGFVNIINWDDMRIRSMWNKINTATGYDITIKSGSLIIYSGSILSDSYVDTVFNIGNNISMKDQRIQIIVDAYSGSTFLTSTSANIIYRLPVPSNFTGSYNYNTGNIDFTWSGIVVQNTDKISYNVFSGNILIYSGSDTSLSINANNRPSGNHTFGIRAFYTWNNIFFDSNTGNTIINKSNVIDITPSNFTGEYIPGLSPDDHKIKLSWDKIDGASYYNIYQGTKLIYSGSDLFTDVFTQYLTNPDSNSFTFSLTAYFINVPTKSSTTTISKYQLPTINNFTGSYNYNTKKVDLLWSGSSVIGYYNIFNENDVLLWSGKALTTSISGSILTSDEILPNDQKSFYFKIIGYYNSAQSTSPKDIIINNRVVSTINNIRAYYNYATNSFDFYWDKSNMDYFNIFDSNNNIIYSGSSVSFVYSYNGDTISPSEVKEFNFKIVGFIMNFYGPDNYIKINTFNSNTIYFTGDYLTYKDQIILKWKKADITRSNRIVIYDKFAGKNIVISGSSILNVYNGRTITGTPAPKVGYIYSQPAGDFNLLTITGSHVGNVDFEIYAMTGSQTIGHNNTKINVSLKKPYDVVAEYRMNDVYIDPTRLGYAQFTWSGNAPIYDLKFSISHPTIKVGTIVSNGKYIFSGSFNIEYNKSYDFKLTATTYDGRLKSEEYTGTLIATLKSPENFNVFYNFLNNAYDIRCNLSNDAGSYYIIYHTGSITPLTRENLLRYDYRKTSDCNTSIAGLGLSDRFFYIFAEKIIRFVSIDYNYISQIKSVFSAGKLPQVRNQTGYYIFDKDSFVLKWDLLEELKSANTQAMNRNFGYKVLRSIVKSSDIKDLTGSGLQAFLDKQTFIEKLSITGTNILKHFTGSNFVHFVENDTINVYLYTGNEIPKFNDVYIFKIIAFSNNFVSSGSYVYISPQIPQVSILGFLYDATPNQKKVNLSWSGVSYVDGYQINLDSTKIYEGINTFASVNVENILDDTLNINIITKKYGIGSIPKLFKIQYKTKCAPNNHLENGICVPNGRSCDVVGGKGWQEYTGTGSTGYTNCMAISCYPGYTLGADVSGNKFCFVSNNSGGGGGGGGGGSSSGGGGTPFPVIKRSLSCEIINDKLYKDNSFFCDVRIFGDMDNVSKENSYCSKEKTPDKFVLGDDNLGRAYVYTAKIDNIHTGNIIIATIVGKDKTVNECRVIVKGYDKKADNGIIEKPKTDNVIIKKESKYLSDVYGHWCQLFVDVLTDKKIVHYIIENNEKLFKPNWEIRKYEAVIMIVRAFNLKNTSMWLKNFSDLKGDWYDRYLYIAVKNNVIDKPKNNLIKPNWNLTKAESVYMILKGAGIDFSNVDISYQRFQDVPGYFKEAKAIYWAKDNNILYEQGMYFNPNKYITRAQFAEVLYKVLEYLNKSINNTNTGNTSIDSMNIIESDSF